MELSETEVAVPEKAIEKTDAFLLVCLAGEVYAEVQGKDTGTGPQEWQRILAEVDAFRTAVGLCAVRGSGETHCTGRNGGISL